MTTYVYRDGEVIAKSSQRVKARSGYYIISDTMPESIWHPAANKYTSSKSGFRQMTKDAGCVEVGNDSSLYRARQQIRLSKDERARDIKRAIDQLKGR